MVCESMVEDQSEGSVSITAMSAQRDDYAPKVRKPYTITKQRERWTEEDHTKFLEALKLYGRAWRLIEEHVGNKTAVQIRSHAQKFFSKVVRGSSCGDETKVKPIEIPPPRSKRKPVHPYPRKQSAPLKKQAYGARSSSPNSSGSNQENQSPTSVLSAGGSETFAMHDSCSPNAGSLHSECDLSADKNGSSHPAQQNDNASVKFEFCLEDKRFVKESSPESTCTQSLKLFGKTVLVTVPHRPASQKEEGQKRKMQEEHGRFGQENQRKISVGDHQGMKKEKCIKGFVPYKKCLAQENTNSCILTGEEKEERRTWLCL